MTFTITIQDFSPSEDALEKLLDGAADLRVEYEADVTPEWDASVGQGSCDVDNLVIESVLAEVKCWLCEGNRHYYVGYMFGPCTACQGKGTQSLGIFPSLSLKDLAWLKEECAEHAREHS